MIQLISTRTCLFLSATVFCGALLFAGIERDVMAQESALLPGTKLDISLSGYVDVSYTQNFNNPSEGANNLRSFDGDANSFRPNMAQFVLERVAKAKGSWRERTGFRAKLNVGEDAKFTGGSGNDDFDFQESYVQFFAPVGNGVMFQAGRMNTLIGYEVIESPLNPNFSRSFLFGMGEPFTVTGLRASYDFTDQVSFAVSAINSFTGLQADNNNSKSVEALLSYAPMDNLGLSLFAFWGPEGERNTNDATDRVMVGGIVDVQVTDKAKVVVEGYYGNQAGHATGTSLMIDANETLSDEDDVFTVTSRVENARWNGIAGYFMYDFNDAWSVRIRGEVFEDAAGAFACAGGGGNALVCASPRRVPVTIVDDTSNRYLGIDEIFLPPDSQTLWETTWTLQYQPVSDFITRLEYRYDKSDKNSFHGGAGLGNHQSTLAVEAIYLF